MCQPLMEVKGLMVLEIMVPTESKSYWDFAKGAPFTIVAAKPGVTF